MAGREIDGKWWCSAALKEYEEAKRWDEATVHPSILLMFREQRCFSHEDISAIFSRILNCCREQIKKWIQAKGHEGDPTALRTFMQNFSHDGPDVFYCPPEDLNGCAFEFDFESRTVELAFLLKGVKTTAKQQLREMRNKDVKAEHTCAHCEEKGHIAPDCLLKGDGYHKQGRLCSHCLAKGRAESRALHNSADCFDKYPSLRTLFRNDQENFKAGRSARIKAEQDQRFARPPALRGQKLSSIDKLALAIIRLATDYAQQRRAGLHTKSNPSWDTLFNTLSHQRTIFGPPVSQDSYHVPEIPEIGTSNLQDLLSECQQTLSQGSVTLPNGGRIDIEDVRSFDPNHESGYLTDQAIASAVQALALQNTTLIDIQVAELHFHTYGTTPLPELPSILENLAVVMHFDKPTHWAVAAYNTTTNQFHILDSLPDAARAGIMRQRMTSVIKHYFPNKLPSESGVRSCHQTNGHDCGIFVLANIDAIDRGNPTYAPDGINARTAFLSGIARLIRQTAREMSVDYNVAPAATKPNAPYSPAAVSYSYLAHMEEHILAQIIHFSEWTDIANLMASNRSLYNQLQKMCVFIYTPNERCLKDGTFELMSKDIHIVKQRVDLDELRICAHHREMDPQPVATCICRGSGFKPRKDEASRKFCSYAVVFGCYSRFLNDTSYLKDLERVPAQLPSHMLCRCEEGEDGHTHRLNILVWMLVWMALLRFYRSLRVIEMRRSAEIWGGLIETTRLLEFPELMRFVIRDCPNMTLMAMGAMTQAIDCIGSGLVKGRDIDFDIDLDCNMHDPWISSPSSRLAILEKSLPHILRRNDSSTDCHHRGRLSDDFVDPSPAVQARKGWLNRVHPLQRAVSQLLGLNPTSRLVELDESEWESHAHWNDVELKITKLTAEYHKEVASSRVESIATEANHYDNLITRRILLALEQKPKQFDLPRDLVQRSQYIDDLSAKDLVAQARGAFHSLDVFHENSDACERLMSNLKERAFATMALRRSASNDTDIDSLLADNLPPHTMFFEPQTNAMPAQLCPLGNLLHESPTVRKESERTWAGGQRFTGRTKCLMCGCVLYNAAFTTDALGVSGPSDCSACSSWHPGCRDTIPEPKNILRGGTFIRSCVYPAPHGRIPDQTSLNILRVWGQPYLPIRNSEFEEMYRKWHLEEQDRKFPRVPHATFERKNFDGNWLRTPVQQAGERPEPTNVSTYGLHRHRAKEEYIRTTWKKIETSVPARIVQPPVSWFILQWLDQFADLTEVEVTMMANISCSPVSQTEDTSDPLVDPAEGFSTLLPSWNRKTAAERAAIRPFLQVYREIRDHLRKQTALSRSQVQTVAGPTDRQIF